MPRGSKNGSGAIIGGVITSTLLTLVVVPVIYTYLDGLDRIPRESPCVFACSLIQAKSLAMLPALMTSRKCESAHR